jgi:dUTP pyrophosphatase
MNISMKILENGNGLNIPFYATDGSAGLDLYAAVTENVVIKRMERALIPTGISLSIPNGFEGQVRPRSGLTYKNGVTVLNAPGTIDSDYRGEIKVLLINFGCDDFVVERELRIAQLVIQKYEKVALSVVDSLDDTVRSCNGYGSTGMS